MDLNLTSRPSGPAPWLVALLCVVYLLSGVVGHDPWKTDDAVGSAVAHAFFLGGNWLTPSLAGEPWYDAEPLYYWIAAGLAKLTQLWLPFHDGARLASPLLGTLFLLLIGLSGRKLHGNSALWGTPLLAIGTLGLLVPVHETQPFAAILAATTAVYLGIALLDQQPKAGAIVAGFGLGTSFLAGGFNTLLPVSMLLLAPLHQKKWLSFGISTGTAVVVGGTWPLLLANLEPAHLASWWTADFNSLVPTEAFTTSHLKLIGWFAWPILYIAGWTLWRNRHQWTRSPIALPALGAATSLLWFLAHSPRPVLAAPMIPPLILLASASVVNLRRGAANAWDWFGMMTFSIIVILVWLGTTALQFGWPSKIASNAAKLAPGFIPELSPFALVIGLIATTAWILAIVRLQRSSWRVTIRWATGVTVAWVLIAFLFTPWIDYGKSYRPVVADLRRTLPDTSECIGRMHLGAPQRAALDYFGHIRTRWGNKTCQWLIVQGSEDSAPPDGWKPYWEGHRPGDRSEWLRLYRRE